MKLPITDEHVKYEKYMLDVIWQSWQPEAWTAATEKLDKETTQSMYNIMHEAFSVHTNNLIDYFLSKDDLYQESNFLFGYQQKVKEQVTTLTEHRTAVMTDKIQYEDHKKVYEWICKKWNSTCPNLN